MYKAGLALVFESFVLIEKLLKKSFFFFFFTLHWALEDGMLARVSTDC